MTDRFDRIHMYSYIYDKGKDCAGRKSVLFFNRNIKKEEKEE